VTYRRDQGWTASFAGVVAATATPFRPAGSLDEGRIEDLVSFLLDRGVAGMMVCGTTGEFPALSTEERIRATRAFVSSASGRAPVIAHVGHVDLDVAKRLADEAADAGASALAALTPHYLPHTPGAIEAHLRSLARRVPDLPFFVYDYPRAAGQEVPFEVFLSLLEEPNLAGVKGSVETVDVLERYLSSAPDLCVMSGNDLLMPAFAAAGGRAVVSGNATAVPEVVVALHRKLLSGDEHGEELGLLRDAAGISRGAPDRLKELLRRRGLDMGPSRFRTHIAGEFDQGVEDVLERVLSAVGSPAAARTPG
jgi:dihydrodipicolinate synthase/N-acetylneuraminate lyase